MGHEAHHMWDVGDPRQSPAGAYLPGKRVFTYWSYRSAFYGKRKFFEEFSRILDGLLEKKDFIFSFLESGGEASIDVGLHGKSNIGDILNREDIGKLYESGFDLGIEVFPEMS